jgi:ABC-type multidrug transport system fused ATPase/permease subunit
MKKKEQKLKKKKKSNSIGLLLKNIIRTIKLYWLIDKKGLLICLVIMVSQALLPALNAYLWGQTLNLVVEYLSNSINDIQIIYLYFIASAGVTAIIFLLWEVFDYVNKMSWYTWHEYMYVEIPKKISSLDVQMFEDPKFKDLLNKVDNGYEHRPADFAEKILWTINQGIQVIASIAIIASFNIILLPIILISLLPGIYFQLKAGKTAWGIWDAKGNVSRMAWSNAWYLRNENYIKEIKIFRLREYILNIIDTLFKDFQSGFRKNERILTIQSLFTGILETSTNICIQFWLLSRVLNRDSGFGVGDFTFINNSIDRLTEGLRNFLRNIARLYEDNLYMSDIYKLLDTETKIISKENAITLPKDNVPSIEFRNVSFIYPGTEKKIFDNLNIEIKSGEDIAIVGENGAGKTTFIKLLLRFYDVTGGEILINGVNIKDIDLDSYYKHIGVLFQDFNKYYFPVKENIAVGDTERELNLDEVIQKSKQAGSHDFISEYKHKYDQLLDRDFKKGTEPSGGQWQRIALARAFYRNASILILDEPTSAIDAKGEYEIFKEIEKVQKEKTTIIISHRFSTVRNADKIYVIERGRIIEKGSHEDLMKVKDGKYKMMFDLQAEGYK